MKNLSILILFLSLAVLSCFDKKEKESTNSNTSIEEVSTELKQEIESIETATEEIKNTQESIEASIKKVDDMLNEI